MGNHAHDWVYDLDQFLTNSPQQQRICASCLTTEFVMHESGRGNQRRFETLMHLRRTYPLRYDDATFQAYLAALGQLFDCGFTSSSASTVAGLASHYSAALAITYLRTLRGTEVSRC